MHLDSFPQAASAPSLHDAYRNLLRVMEGFMQVWARNADEQVRSIDGDGKDFCTLKKGEIVFPVARAVERMAGSGHAEDDEFKAWVAYCDFVRPSWQGEVSSAPNFQTMGKPVSPVLVRKRKTADDPGDAASPQKRDRRVASWPSLIPPREPATMRKPTN